MTPPIVHIFDDADELAQAAADAIVLASAQAVTQRGRFDWAVAGGGTPRRTYAALASAPRRNRFPWDRTAAWLGDERVVACTDPASNHRMVLEHLIRPAGADPASLHAFDTDVDPVRSAREYAKRLEQDLPSTAEGVPELDLVLLGLGADAHTASWFPGSEFPEDAWVAATAEAHAGYRRLTLTPRVVNSARRVLFLAAGRVKRRAVARVLDGPRDPTNVPAQRVAPVRGQVMWMLDRDAAGQSLTD